MKKEKILEGIRVLDITDFLAGPFCTKYLADCGCEVITIERPGGKIGRALPYIHKEKKISVEYLNNHAGKKSFGIDMKAKGAKEVMWKLVENSDVIVENLRPGALAKLGLDYEHVRKINPSVIMCSISGWGQQNSRSDLLAMDALIQSALGIAHMMAEREARPYYVGFAITDILAALTAFGGICAALYRRSVTGEGDYIDIALTDSTFAALPNQVIASVVDNHDFRYMAGSYSADFAPAGAFKASNGYLMIYCRTHEEWEHLVNLMDKKELLEDPRFTTIEDRVKHKEKLAEFIESWLQKLDVQEVALLLKKHHLLAEPISSLGEFIGSEKERYLQEREMLLEIEHPEYGEMTYVNTPLKFNNYKSKTTDPPPFIAGEHSGYVLRRILKFKEEDIKKLKEEGVIFGTL